MFGRDRRGKFGAVCFPIVAVVDEEVGDVVEDFERDGIVEWHDGGCLMMGMAGDGDKGERSDVGFV